MVCSTEDIQRDIERNRSQFARILDEPTVRTNPKNATDDVKTRVLNALNESKVQAALGVVVALVAGGIAMGIRRNRNRSKKIGRIHEMTEIVAK